MLLVTALTHPIDTTAHPTCPAGYRWAAYLGAGAWHELERCLNAGWAPDPAEAAFEAEKVAAAVVRGLRLCGVADARMAPVALDVDPIPAGRDNVHVLEGV